jgi:two-component system, OmpR family, phosphate regulon sensor histidine kinase PhoR
VPLSPPRLAGVGRWGTAEVVDPRVLQSIMSALVLLEWAGRTLPDPTTGQLAVAAAVVVVLAISYVAPWGRWWAQAGAWPVAWLAAVDVILLGAVHAAVPGSLSIVLIGGPALWLGRVGARGIYLCAAAGTVGVIAPALINDGIGGGAAVTAVLPVVVAVAASVSKSAALRRDDYERRATTALVESAGVGLQLVDPTGTTLRQNGLVPQIGSSTIGLVGSDHPMRPSDRPVARTARGEQLDGMLVWVEPDDAGGRRFYSVSGRPVLDPRGEVAGAALSWHNVTPLVEALDGERDLLAYASHELRSPMTAIAGYLELLGEDDTADSQVLIERMRGSSDRMLQMLNDLLVTSETRRGDVELNRTEHDVGALVRERVAEIGPRAEAAGVSIDVALEGGLTAYVDPARIGQVVDNLVSNAVKYSNDGGRVAVTVWPQGDDVVIRVTDIGIGIGPDDLAHLFERWFRADAVRRGPVAGTGLGLSIARQIIELHGGTIEVTSELGRGSTFVVRLPRDAPAIS